MGPIVVGVDGSAGSEDAVSFAMRGSATARLPGRGGPRRLSRLVHSGGLQALSPALAAGRERNPAVEVREVVEAGNAAELIVAHAKDAALVVVGSRGHGGLAGMLLGSVSRAVVEQSDCSVVVMRQVT